MNSLLIQASEKQQPQKPTQLVPELFVQILQDYNENYVILTSSFVCFLPKYFLRKCSLCLTNCCWKRNSSTNINDGFGIRKFVTSNSNWCHTTITNNGHLHYTISVVTIFSITLTSSLKVTKQALLLGSE